MASKALEFRLREAERQLARLREDASELREATERLEAQIASLRRALEEAPPREPAVPPPLPEVLPAPVPPPVADEPASPPQPPPAPPSVATAPRPPIAARPVAPQPVLDEAPVRREALELEFGRVWFVRLGIGLLLTGFVFLSTYAYQNYIVNWGAGYRLAALYTAAVLLTVAGFFLERWKESLRNYGRVVAAGGWAAIYYTTYAAHHVAHLRVIESPVLAAVFLSLVALGFFSYAASRRSSLLAVGALILAFYATAINPMGWLGCFSGLLLSAIGMVFFLRFDWLRTGVASLLGAYLSYAYWHGLINASLPEDLTRWFLVAYWLLFTAAILAPQSGRHTPEFRVAFASANNLLFFFLFAFHFPSGTWADGLWVTALTFGSVLVALSAALAFRGGFPPLLRNIYLAKGLALVTWAFSLKLTGEHLFLTLTLESLVLAIAWRGTRSPVLRTFVWIATAWAALLALASLLPASEPVPELAHLIQGGLFILLALLMRGAPWIRPDARLFSLEALTASLLALIIPTAAFLESSPAENVGLVLLGSGLALWIAYALKPDRWPLPELVWLTQGAAILGAVLVLHNTGAPWHLALTSLLAAITFQLHGLASDRNRTGDLPAASRVFDYIFSGLALLALGMWMFRTIDSADLLLLLITIVPLAGHFYGSALKRSSIAIHAQLFYLVTIASSALAWNPADMEAPTRLAALGAVLLVALHFTLIQLIPLLRFRSILRESHLLITALLWSGWLFAFVDPWHLPLAWSGCALFLLPPKLQTTYLQPVYLAYLALALGGVSFFDDSQSWQRYAVLPAAFLVHLVQSRREGSAGSERSLPWSGLAGFLILALTIIVSQHTLELFEGKGLAVTWALLGLSCFGLGLGVRVRTYRLGGLVLLALSLGHVLVVDVWKLDTVLRIVSFLTLGLVLLSLGFVYNRWHETLRRLL